MDAERSKEPGRDKPPRVFRDRILLNKWGKYPFIVINDEVLIRYKSMNGAGIMVEFENTKPKAKKDHSKQSASQEKGNIGSKRLKVARRKAIGRRLQAKQYDFVVLGKNSAGIQVEVVSPKEINIDRYWFQDSRVLMWQIRNQARAKAMHATQP